MYADAIADHYEENKTACQKFSTVRGIGKKKKKKTFYNRHLSETQKRKSKESLARFLNTTLTL